MWGWPPGRVHPLVKWMAAGAPNGKQPACVCGGGALGRAAGEGHCCGGLGGVLWAPWAHRTVGRPATRAVGRTGPIGRPLACASWGCPWASACTRQQTVHPCYFMPAIQASPAAAAAACPATEPHRAQQMKWQWQPERKHAALGCMQVATPAAGMWATTCVGVAPGPMQPHCSAADLHSSGRHTNLPCR